MCKKYLWIMPSLKSGGAEKLTLDIVSKINASKLLEIDLLIIKNIVSYTVPDNITLHYIVEENERVSHNIFQIIKDIIRLKKQYKNIIVGQEFEYPLLLLPLIYNKNKITIVHSQLSLYLKVKYKNNWLLSKLISLFYSRYNKIICVSKGIEKDLVEKFTLQKDKIFTIYNGIEINDITCPKKLTYENIKILTVGRLEKQKNYFFLLDVFKSYLLCFPLSQLTLCGEGSQKIELEKYSRDIGIADNVNFLGFVSDIQKEYCTHDIYIQTSIFEGFGLGIVEAMNTGLPVISSNAPSGPGEILFDSELLINNFILDDYVNALKKLSSNDLYYQQHCEYSRKRSHFFSIEKTVDNYINLLK